MPETNVMTGAEPFIFEGNEVGCLVSHGFTGSTQSMHFLGEYLANEGGLTVVGPRLNGCSGWRILITWPPSIMTKN